MKPPAVSSLSSTPPWPSSKKLGVRLQRIYSDNGPAYRSCALASQVASLGLKHRFTRFYTPKTNGKAERFIQTSLREWAYAHSDQRSDRLRFFLHNYNGSYVAESG